VKFAQKRSAPKWTSNKMGNAKKGHNKTGRSKVIARKDVLPNFWPIRSRLNFFGFLTISR